MSHSNSAKGQVVGSEFIVACVIFLLVLATVLFIWQLKTAEITRAELISDMDHSGTNAVEMLLRNPGVPGNWDTYDLDKMENISLGLSDESRVLESGKVERFLAMMDVNVYDNPCGGGISNYDCNRYLMGLGRYEFYVNMSYLDGTFVGETGNFPSNPDYLLVKRRNAMLDGEIVNVRLYLWV